MKQLARCLLKPQFSQAHDRMRRRRHAFAARYLRKWIQYGTRIEQNERGELYFAQSCVVCGQRFAASDRLKMLCDDCLE